MAEKVRCIQLLVLLRWLEPSSILRRSIRIGHSWGRRPYIALTYEYTFKADAKGRAADQYGDLALDGTDLEGSTGIVSLGWTYQNEARDFEFDAGMNGYAGKRRGISAQLQAAWKF